MNSSMPSHVLFQGLHTVFPEKSLDWFDTILSKSPLRTQHGNSKQQIEFGMMGLSISISGSTSLGTTTISWTTRLPNTTWLKVAGEGGGECSRRRSQCGRGEDACASIVHVSTTWTPSKIHRSCHPLRVATTRTYSDSPLTGSY